ncbi:nitroreductase [Metamycoplasma neophronis]|uniref:NAD(P)H nitroreductase n=1 Tax=Metamycoplasma neophronis TaxID=872983 RepID=A0ABY2Z0F9_9BACT|nr:nitroreductase [Metamycoplasma neophronis]TPR54371.1 NAD(P)H nitroreductase [Metamycoplasma neophronis]
MEFKEVIKNRKSIRDFLDKEIDDEIILQIMKDAQQSASWMNSQPWKVYVLKGELLKKIREDHLRSVINSDPISSDYKHYKREEWPAYISDHITQMSLIRNETVDNKTFNELNWRLFNSPAIVLLCLPKNALVWNVLDLGAFSSTLMLSAQNYGIDSVHAYEIVKYGKNLHEIANIPYEFDIVSGIALGYRSDHKINSYKSQRIDVKDFLEILK